MKNIITEVPLHCIASFLIGSYTVLLINFFWFDNHITPPGVSAFVASCALLFTVYAAFKVKAWSEQKMNDKAFKVAEDIIEDFIMTYKHFSFSSGYLLQFLERNNLRDFYITHRDLENYDKKRELASECYINVVNGFETLPIWKYEITCRNEIAKFKSHIHQFDNLALEILKLTKVSNAANMLEAQKHIVRLKKIRMNVTSSYKEIIDMTFDEIFKAKKTKKLID